MLCNFSLHVHYPEEEKDVFCAPGTGPASAERPWADGTLPYGPETNRVPGWPIALPWETETELWNEEEC